MSLFLALLVKILPLYVLILLGLIANKFLHVSKESISGLIIYILAPAIVLLGTIQSKSHPELLLIPIIFFFVSTTICLLNYFSTRKLWHDGTEKVLMFASGTGNVGYFGLPVCLAIVGDIALPIVVMVTLGLMVFENTIAFYIVARASHSKKDALLKVFKLPHLYFFVTGILLNFFNFTPAQQILDFLDSFKTVYFTLGMMVIGLSLAEIKAHHVDWKFTTIALFNKFILWPAIFLGLIYLDTHYAHIFDQKTESALLIEALVPLSVTSVIYATELKVHPEKVALTVAISTLIALFYIPAAIAFLL
ncbi:AEC family transporter [Candidatus Peregrinibacteria bacterium]|nr:AEC family transporter [Candidatus Peregrinibacteria bacterium]